jgi:hypothetical protein
MIALPSFPSHYLPLSSSERVVMLIMNRVLMGMFTLKGTICNVIYSLGFIPLLQDIRERLFEVVPVPLYLNWQKNI